MATTENTEQVDDTRELLDLLAQLSPSDRAQVKGIIIGLRLKKVSQNDENFEQSYGQPKG